LGFGGGPPSVAGDGGLLGWGLRLAPGLPDLSLAGWPAGVLGAGGLVIGLGLDDGAGEVDGGHFRLSIPGRVRTVMATIVQPQRWRAKSRFLTAEQMW
jgi:hypothetical protein